jgi:hypothetical protein
VSGAGWRSAAEGGAAGVLEPGLVLVADELVVEVDAAILEPHLADVEGGADALPGERRRLLVESGFVLGQGLDGRVVSGLG